MFQFRFSTILPPRTASPTFIGSRRELGRHGGFSGPGAGFGAAPTPPVIVTSAVTKRWRRYNHRDVSVVAAARRLWRIVAAVGTTSFANLANDASNSGVATLNLTAAHQSGDRIVAS